MTSRSPATKPAGAAQLFLDFVSTLSVHNTPIWSTLSVHNNPIVSENDVVHKNKNSLNAFVHNNKMHGKAVAVLLSTPNYSKALYGLVSYTAPESASKLRFCLH